MIRIKRKPFHPLLVAEKGRKTDTGKTQHTGPRRWEVACQGRWRDIGWQCPRQGHDRKMMREAGKRLSPDYKSLVYRDSDLSLLVSAYSLFFDRAGSLHGML